MYKVFYKCVALGCIELPALVRLRVLILIRLSKCLCKIHRRNLHNLHLGRLVASTAL